MTYEIVKEFPDKVIYEKDDLFVSIYQTTHRSSPDNKQDVIVFKNLIKEIEDSLAQRYSKKDITRLLGPVYEIRVDHNFWINTLDGLGIIACRNRCAVYVLNSPMKELAVVAQGPHIKPLIRFFQSPGKYQILVLSRNGFRLFEGNLFGLEEIRIDPSVPRTIEEVLGEEVTESYLNHGSYSGTGGSAIYHGHGARREEIQKDTTRYFRYVDKYVYDNHSKITGLPLILNALPEHQGEFRKVSHNNHLVKEGINHSDESLKPGQLRRDAEKIIEPLYMKKAEKMINSFYEAKAREAGTDDIEEAARAASENRIAVLLIEADRIVPGKYDNDTGQVVLGEIKDPEYNDILDDIAEAVIKNHGTVAVLPKESMPSATGAAAVFRY